MRVKRIGMWLSLRKVKVLLIVIGLITYGNTLFNEYSLDDNFAVTENSYVLKGIQGIPEILTHHYYELGDKKAAYTPIPGILSAIEYQFFGLNPHVSHLLNIIFFVLLLLLILRVLKEVFGLNEIHPWLPLVITIFYAVHPAFTEVVASIKNRSEILSLIFALLALLYAHKFFVSEQGKWILGIWVILLLALSYLAKMVTTPMAGIIVLTGIFYGAYRNRSFYILSAGVLLFTIIFMVLVMANLNIQFYPFE